MTENIRAVIVENIKKCTYFSLQMDESKDILNCDQFTTFVKYNTSNDIKEDVLFWTPLETNTAGKNLFDAFMQCIYI